MLAFIARRLMIAAGVLIAASYIFYLLAASSGDPLEDLRASTQRNREQLVELRTAELQLDVNPALRYFTWAGGAAKCLIGQCDLGEDWRTGQPVTTMLGSAMGSTLQLIGFASIFAIVVGVAVGIVSALRQYTGFDYGVTFAAFLMYSLPSFFVAVLLKQWGAIGFNDFLRDPVIPIPALLVIGAVAGIIVGSALSGSWPRKIAIGGTFGLATAAILGALSATGWFLDPRLGPVVILVFGLGSAYFVTFIAAGLNNKRALYTGLAVAVIGAIAWFPLQEAFRFATVWMVLGVLAGLIAIGMVIGKLAGGPDNRVQMRVGGLTALPVFGLLFVDYLMSWWERYSNSSTIGGRPIATVGSQTPQLAGSGYWVETLDTFTHLILPVTAIVLISLAGYTRYARASLLEVMNLDYIRTARAKGLNERTVVMRHAFRNALIPLATIIPLDIAALIGGAVITETIFGWNGMGRLFVESLRLVNLDPLMGYFLVTGILLLIGNILADILYAVLDPRIRVE
ncbi:MAG: ABC transporter permease [Actinobacteria bacterium HGW-Actinobacteria-4]|nr:MAG: ABC transporter permease [Actinobacteria bacterium HGW-Actinobacteria-4]